MDQVLQDYFLHVVLEGVGQLVETDEEADPSYIF